MGFNCCPTTSRFVDTISQARGAENSDKPGWLPLERRRGTQKHLGLDGEREKNRKVCHRPGAPPPFPVFSFKLILVLRPPKSERPDEEEGAVWRKSESQSQSQEERHLYRLEVRSRWRYLKKKAFRTNRPTNPVAYSILLYAKIQGQKMSVAFEAPLRSLVYRRRQ